MPPSTVWFVPLAASSLFSSLQPAIWLPAALFSSSLPLSPKCLSSTLSPRLAPPRGKEDTAEGPAYMGESMPSSKLLTATLSPFYVGSH